MPVRDLSEFGEPCSIHSLADHEAREEEIPLSRMRQVIARNMLTSVHTTARAWSVVEANMENVVQARAAAKETLWEREHLKLTYMPFLARAACQSLRTHPEVNAEIRGDHLIRKHYVNLGIAVALDDGLIVPTISEAEKLDVIDLARAISDLADRARTRKLTPDRVQGGTFTITNPGYGTLMAEPLINPPQCAILALGAIERRPVADGDTVSISHMAYLSMSWDHRIIDGLTAAKFLAQLKQNLETSDFLSELGVPASRR